ncbi:M3 family oligoendopeptidase [Bdellovibrio svalbardensis]|uniref:M3 family oligoendopeptidase n=1 Tax=Bdellovibrio svalbardensis TaxID=2972972 RepID=A0ABT6DJ43_9BACT|nr:M3 family oligoendopeptidase [Bdellovibrio svalbardensis]MDG0816877.1 M3 family oligoendopeptidase [Bdellovibrio svalbardensis]
MNTPAWNIESEYPSINSKPFQSDWEAVVTFLKQMESGVAAVKDHFANPDAATISKVQDLYILEEKCSILLGNLFTYLHCILSVDATDSEAKGRVSELESIHSKISQALTPLDIFMKRCDEKTFQQLVSHPDLKGHEFIWSQKRLQAIYLLSEAEETLLEGLSVTGHNAWGNLYSNLSGKMKVQLKYPDRTEEVGLAKAHSLTRTSNELDRKVAWLGIQEAWTEHQETAAGVLNALAGWRHEVNSKRSHKKEMSFLDQPLWDNRISQETLQALMTACENNIADIQKAPALMAKVLKKKQLDPWDLLAPSPVSASTTEMSFADGAQLISDSFAQVSPDMADFVKMMVKNQWIEGRVLPNKTTGAYCTGFSKSLEPRVYMTYMGSNSDVSTLAHELGHAFHSWVMRDMPRAQMNYPMTLAETASIFAETVLHDALIQKASSFEEKVEFAWNDVEGAMALLLNIPTRFEFEKKFYEMRKERIVDASELRKLMDETWSKWYGTTLSKNDDLFWAHKLHFHISGLSFYNFPYTFGYLFSLSIYARRKELGSNFMKTYVEILRDTGRMTAEDLIQKHLGEDIRRPEFWQKSIDVVKEKINKFEKLIQ